MLKSDTAIAIFPGQLQIKRRDKAQSMRDTSDNKEKLS